jgi:hypothetical protein
VFGRWTWIRSACESRTLLRPLSLALGRFFEIHMIFSSSRDAGRFRMSQKLRARDGWFESHAWIFQVYASIWVILNRRRKFDPQHLPLKFKVLALLLSWTTQLRACSSALRRQRWFLNDAILEIETSCNIFQVQRNLMLKSA